MKNYIPKFFKKTLRTVPGILFAAIFIIYVNFEFCAHAAGANRTTPSVSNLYIDVGTPNSKKLRLAIPYFYMERTSPAVKNTLVSATNRFKDILDFTSWFYFIPNDRIASNFKTPAVVRPFQAEEWKPLQADFVILAQFVQRRKYIDLELRAVNVATQKTILDKVYTEISLDASAKSEELNFALRDFGDLFIQSITGTPGPFMTQIVFVGRISPRAQTSNIYIADFDGSNAYSITHNNTINMSPAWSPDGKKITYTSFKTGKAEIFEYDVASQKTVQITFENSNTSGSNWNPAGDIIAFSSSTTSGATHIYTITGAGDTKEALIDSSGIEVEPAFSPNGLYLAYTSNKYSKPMIFLYNLDNHQNTRLTYAGWYNASAAWNPNSEEIAFASFDKSIDRWDLFKIKANGSSLERLTLKQADNEKPSWSPDGRFIMFQSNRGEMPYQNTIKGNPYRLFVMSADGSNQKLLRTSIYDCRQPSWGPRVQVFEE